MTKQQRLIVFLVPPEKMINGGILSIFSICKESRRLKNIHHADVVMCTFPGHPSFVKNDLFKNDEIIYSFDQIVKQGAPSYLQIHIPEYASNEIFQGIKDGYADYIRSIDEFSVNVMNQNIMLMPAAADIAKWFYFTPSVTQTTAHSRYCTQEIADQYNIPTHYLSVFNDPSQYEAVPFEKKLNRIVLSPDNIPEKEAIVKKLKKAFPDYEFVTILNMTYEEYKKIMSKAKFAVTFGEGFDGYFIEAFFCKGITFSVYNDEFFPDKKFAEFDNVYDSYEDMGKNIVADMKRLAGDKGAYNKLVQQNFKIITKLYDFSIYLKNLENFYRRQFTLLPSPQSTLRLIIQVIEKHGEDLASKDREISALKDDIKGRIKHISELDQLVEQIRNTAHEREVIIDGMLRSISWRVTKPLRKLNRIAKR